MSERKVLNKYYPPDFDPTKIPRLRLSRDRQYTVRLMAPCNMRCTTCGEYIYKGKKFNARKETVQNEEYLGIKVFRFYIKCPRCLAEVTFKTDPENADYIVEHGATRNFQALKLAEEAAEREAKELEEEEKNNPMKLLENRTKASKQEMDVLESLEELKDLNQRHMKVDLNVLLERKRHADEEALKRQEEEDEEYVRSVFRTSDGERIKRLLEEDDSDDEEYDKPSTSLAPTKPPPNPESLLAPKRPKSDLLRLNLVRPKDAAKQNSVIKAAVSTVQKDGSSNSIDEIKNSGSTLKTGLALLTTYSGSSEDSP